MAQLTYSDPLRQRKRVHYTGSDTLYEGEPLCYSFKTTRNWYGYSDSAGAIGDTTAEGSHNEGKYIYVESPIRVSTTSGTFTVATKLLTGSTTDFDTLQVGMFVSVASSNDDDIDGIYEITAISRSTESGVTNSTITFGNMTDAVAAASAATAGDVTVQIDNISSFAGVVAAGSWVGQAGPCELDIYVPNGAVVPVRTDQNCTAGRTILAIHTNEQHLTGPYDTAGRPVAIAWETVDNSSAAALCLAQLDPNKFLYQKGDDTRLLIDDQDTGNGMTANYLGVNSNCASGDFSNLVVCSTTATVSNHSLIYASLLNTGTGAAGFHVMQVRGKASGTAIAGNINGIFSQIDINAAAITTGGIAAGLWSKVHVKASAGALAGNVVAGRFSLQLDSEVTGKTAQLYFEHHTAAAQTPDYFFITASGTDSTESIAYEADTTGTDQIGAIKIYLGNADDDGYIRVYSDAQGQTSA